MKQYIQGKIISFVEWLFNRLMVDFYIVRIPSYKRDGLWHEYTITYTAKAEREVYIDGIKITKEKDVK